MREQNFVDTEKVETHVPNAYPLEARIIHNGGAIEVSRGHGMPSIIRGASIR